MRGEWKACDTRSATVRSNCPATSATESAAPESTTEAGPLTAATPTSVRSPRAARTSASEARTATMAPPSGSACISLPRAATSMAASSRESTPATWAAANSPTEWPATRSGTTPQCSSSRYSATSKANSAGCVYSVRSSSRPPSSDGVVSHITSRRGRSSCTSRCPTTSSRAEAKTGWRAYSSRPMPAHWLPWPENRKAVRPSTGAPVTRTESSAPADSAARPRSASSLPYGRSTARCSNAARPTARV